MDLKNPYYLKYAFYGKYLIPKYTQDYCYIDGIMHLTEILCVCVFLAPTRSPRSHFVRVSVCLSVCLAQSCLEHSIFILEPQILHDDFMKSS